MTKQIKTWQERSPSSESVYIDRLQEVMQAEIDELRAALAQPEQAAQCFTDWWATIDGAPSYQETFEAGRRAQPASEPLSDEQLFNLLFEIDRHTQRIPPGFKQFARALEAAHGITKGQQ